MSDKTTTSSPGLIDEKLLNACIHCGLCLPACPTYLATGREMESPRGRIALLSQWNRGELPLSDRLAEHIESCLGCFGCQTACPSGVQYEHILDQAKPHIAAYRPESKKTLMRFVFKHILPDYPRLRQAAGLLKIWQSFGGIGWLKRFAGIDDSKSTDKEKAATDKGLKGLVQKLVDMEALLPRMRTYTPLPRKSWSSGEKKGTVQIFAGCVMDVFYNHVNHAAVKLLTAQSQIVETPPQTCCGALAFHAGEVEIARDLARRNIDSFQSTQGRISVTSAGCGAMLKQYGEILKDDQNYATRAEEFSGRVEDITQSLANNEFKRRTDLNDPGFRRVAYHAACHLAHAQGVRQEPAKLLLQLAEDWNASAPDDKKLELVPLQEAEHCCGSAGIYNLLHPEMSTEVLVRKIDCVAQTNADAIVTTNPGCMLQIDAGLKDRGIAMKTEHLCEILGRAYCDS